MNSTNLSKIAPTHPVQAIGDLRAIASNNLNNRVEYGLGFYSNSHRGILTHPKSNMHIHFKTTDDKLFVGHINNSLILKPDSYLLLPKEIMN